MSVTPNEALAAEPEKERPLTMLDLAIAMALAGTVVGAIASVYLPLKKKEAVLNIVRAEALTGKELAPCSVLIGSLRHEGKCGSFGKYSVLSGGRDLYVFDGPSDNPRIVGNMGLVGFHPTQELQDFALQQ